MKKNGNGSPLLAAVVFAIAYNASLKRSRVGGGRTRRYGGFRRKPEGIIPFAEWKKIPAWKREAIYQAKQRRRARGGG